ncbi:MAG TPA: non-canonical purine NTP pyrophosphatase [Candidatus Limnocylindrales bacterium]|nr:non-canonical purine NTP pyrophosphatase [Candidatus Limnocylindrales bacterium]
MKRGAAGPANPRVVVATHSAHKLRELRQMLRLDGLDLVSLDDLGIAGEPVEDGLTFETNARIKARFAARATGLPALADDSGIEVEALGGAPGVRTRRYAGPNATDEDNNDKLMRELAAVAVEQRGARYVCVLALALPDAAAPGGLRLIERRGTTRGRVALESRGSGGFGYDPLFEPARERVGGRTFAEYSPAEKDAISHRGRAARRMAPVLQRLIEGRPPAS